jgi:intracellular multiplication protein IcmB
MPGNEARARLARRFPGGSCKKLVERLKAEMFNTADFVDDDTASSVIERIAQEIMDEPSLTAARAH